MPPSDAPLLSVADVSKRFGPVVALERVSVEFRAGEVHALLGENGAGKSTLMNILNGTYPPDEGTIRLDGDAVRFSSPLAARRAHIGMVHQHFTLIDALTVAENLALNFSGERRWRFDPQHAAAEAQRFAHQLGLEIPAPTEKVANLPVGIRQRLEIVKALAGSVRVLILDEPTAVLTPAEADQLLSILKRLRATGCAIIFITHKLREARATADRITVLRRGRVSGAFAGPATSENDLARCMIEVDVPLSLQAPVAPHAQGQGAAPSTGPPALAVQALELESATGLPLLQNIDFRLAAGEIAAIAGVDGNGQSELFAVLAGLVRPTSGTVAIGGRELAPQSPADVLAAGLALIPPDRHRDGLVLTMTIAENSILNRVLLDRSSRHGWLAPVKIRELAQTAVRDYAVRTNSIDVPISRLSGGNQQRVVIARALAQRPKVLVTVNPTRGLDIAATAAVYEALRVAAANGCAILLISTDLDEVLALGHTVRVMYRGRLGEALRPPIEIDQLALRMAGAA